MPFRIDCITVEPAANMIVDASEDHSIQRGGDCTQRLLVPGPQRLIQKEKEQRFAGKLGSHPKAAIERVQMPEDVHRGLRHRPRRNLAQIYLAGKKTRNHLVHPGSLATNKVRIVTPRPLDLLQHVHEILGQEIAACMKRIALGCQEDRVWPATGAGQHLGDKHELFVQIGARFAVDLDRHEKSVQQRRNGLVFETLLLHDMAPMTRGIADRDEDQLALIPRLGECFRAPGVPVHRIVKVLQQVRRLCAFQMVGLAGRDRGGRDHERENQKKDTCHALAQKRYWQRA